jgi:predicted regulator of Ras-like GTPase activity (Roadblock/LC7/MglB family)
VSGAEQRNDVHAETSGDLSWLLDDLVARVAGVDKAVILSRDGLVSGSSRQLLREDAEHLSAVAAGFQSLARGAGLHFGGGGVRQTIVEMDNAFMFVTAAGEGSCLAVLSPASADVGLVAYEMAILVKRVGPHLLVNPRPMAAMDQVE